MTLTAKPKAGKFRNPLGVGKEQRETTASARNERDLGCGRDRAGISVMVGAPCPAHTTTVLSEGRDSAQGKGGSSPQLPCSGQNLGTHW